MANEAEKIVADFCKAFESKNLDAIMAFFTDDAVLPRPLLGSLNLLAASGATVAGVAALPFDRGALLGAALRGAVFSVPELAFVNIRNGSISALPHGWVKRSALESR